MRVCVYQYEYSSPTMKDRIRITGAIECPSTDGVFFSKQLDEVQHEIEMDILQPYRPKSCVISPGVSYMLE